MVAIDLIAYLMQARSLFTCCTPFSYSCILFGLPNTALTSVLSGMSATDGCRRANFSSRFFDITSLYRALPAILDSVATQQPETPPDRPCTKSHHRAGLPYVVVTQ